MKNRFLLAIAASVALAACGDFTAPDEVVYGVAVATAKSPGASFAGLNTYYLDTTIAVRKDGQAATPPTTPMPQVVQDAINAQMRAAGYTAADVATAQVGLSLTYITNSVDYYYSGGYCDIWYGYYGCYYPPVYAGSYRYGTAILNMVDKRSPANPGAPFPGRWVNFMYGVVTEYAGSASYNTSRLVEAIDRGFAQSPYLNAP
jgi:hypothetical protein